MEFETKGEIHWLIENLETNGNDSCTTLRNVKQSTLWHMLHNLCSHNITPISVKISIWSHWNVAAFDSRINHKCW